MSLIPPLPGPLELTTEFLQVRNAGANRGARLMQPAIQDFNRRSERFRIKPLYVDPEPQRAAALAREATARGVDATGVESRIEDVIKQEPPDETSPVILQVDRPATVASTLETLVGRPRPVLAYQLLRTPSQELYGVAIVLQPSEDALKRLSARFFGKLAEVTARSGASHVVGERGRPQHIALEPAYRNWFATHMKRNLTKVVAGTEPESAPFEVTRDGKTTLPLVIQDSGSGWLDASTLARAVAGNPSFRIVPGEDFVVGEIGPDGIRLHRVRLRKTDGLVSIRGTVVVDPSTIAEAEERERAARALETAMAKAARETLSWVRPSYTTD